MRAPLMYPSLNVYVVVLSSLCALAAVALRVEHGLFGAVVRQMQQIFGS